MKHIGKLLAICCGILLLSPLSLIAQSSGVAREFARRPDRSQTRRPEVPTGLTVPCNPSRPPAQLAVSDDGNDDVEIFYGNFNLNPGILGTSLITKGINGPDGMTYDQTGNLYVANFTGVTVKEYAPCTDTPSFTYSAGLGDPVDVATDNDGNVYVADYNFGTSNGFVAEYFQATHAMKHQCFPGGPTEGVVVDSSGNVFVSYNGSDNLGHIAEYVGGLHGCHETVLGVTLGFAGGLKMDTNGNLVACDQFAGVDIIPPPFTTVSRTITGAVDAFHIALNRANSLLFIADAGSGEVLVVTYPHGTITQTLGSSDGINLALGVAAYQ